MMVKDRIYILFTTITLMVALSAWTMPVGAETVSSVGFEADAVDAYISGQMEKHGIQGISIAVTSKKEIIYLKGYGTTGDARPMTPQTPMYIGSQSKSFTGLAIAQLIEQGRLKPNDAVQKYIPWFEVADEETSAKITINHLLHHTSGLSETGFTVSLPEDATNEDAVRALASAELTAPVGSTFNISMLVMMYWRLLCRM